MLDFVLLINGNELEKPVRKQNYSAFFLSTTKPSARVSMRPGITTQNPA